MTNEPIRNLEELTKEVEHWRDVARVSWGPITEAIDTMDSLLSLVRPHQAEALDVQEGGDHYKGYAIQPFDFVRRNNVPHAEGECIYKLLRWRDKGGVADLRKVVHTVQLIIEEEEKKNGNEPV